MQGKRQTKLRFKAVFSDPKKHPYKQVDWDEYGLGRGIKLRQRIDRVVRKYSETGAEQGYFATIKDRNTFERELTWLLLNQVVCPDSAVWRSVGTDGSQQVSCNSIISVENTIESKFGFLTNILNILSNGSSVGVNLSKIDSDVVGLLKMAEKLLADYRTRKLFILDIDHPEITDFINYSHDVLQAQNTYLAVRISDDFMKAVESDSEFGLRSRQTGEVIETVKAKSLFSKIAVSCANQNLISVQFDTTINSMHTTALNGKNTATSPDGDFISVDNTEAPRAILDLLSFFDGRAFDFEKFISAIEIAITMLDISISFGDFSTRLTREQTKKFRPIGIGFVNLEALFEELKIKPNSSSARNLAGAITSLMSAVSHRQSTELARAVGANEVLKKNFANQHRVVKQHYAKSMSLTDEIIDDENAPINIKEVIFSANLEWDVALEFGKKYAYRNCQVSLLAPSSGFIFDEVKVSKTVNPKNQIKLIASLQPYISGGIGWTYNLSRKTTATEIEELYILAWKSELKSLSFRIK